MEFTKKELSQILYLWDQYMRIGNKIDRRKVNSRRIQQWAVNRGLAVWECNHGYIHDDWFTPPWTHEYMEGGTGSADRGCRWSLRFRRLEDRTDRYVRFMAEQDLPAEILWHYIRRFIRHDTGEVRGYSINSQKGWLDLNIYEAGSRYDPDNKHLDCRLLCLDRLQRAGYLILQTAGSIWQITLLDKGEK